MSIHKLAVALALALSSVSFAVASEAPAAVSEASGKAKELDRLYAEYWEESLKLSPLSATYVGDPRYNDQLPNTYTAEYRAKTLAFNQRWLARIQAISPDGLDGQSRLSHELFVRDLKNDIEATRYPGWKQPLNQFGGLPGQFAQLGSGSGAQPFKTVKDYENWLARASHLPELMATMQDNMRIGIKDGVVQPKALMVKVLPQLDALIKDKPEDTLFWRPVQNFPGDFS